MSSTKRRIHIWLDEPDRHAIATIRQRYGYATDSDAVRMALRVLAQSETVTLRPPAAAGTSAPAPEARGTVS